MKLIFSLLKKPALIAGIVLFLVIGFGAFKCNQHRQTQKLIKHNNEKRDKKVNEVLEKDKTKQEIERIKFERKKEMATKIKLYSQVLKDKECILEQKELESDTPSQDCLDEKPALSDDEIKKRVDRIFKEFEF